MDDSITIEEFKEALKDELEIDKDSWAMKIGDIGQVKDSKLRKAILTIINHRIDEAVEQLYNKFDDYVRRNWILIADVPSAKRLFDILTDRLKSHKAAIEDEKKQIVIYEKELAKIDDYDKRREKDSDIFWSKHRIQEYENKIKIYADLIREIEHDIKSERRR